jgi:5-methylcytosine-specific restriction endonuclease McrA
VLLIMPREHRVTHPTLGPATWREIQQETSVLRALLGVNICHWCHRTVPAGCRTQCGASDCTEAIWSAYSWSHLRSEVLRKQRFCLCGKRAEEVDHIIPVSLGGTGDRTNLRGLCHDCHRQATARLRREGKSYVA